MFGFFDIFLDFLENFKKFNIIFQIFIFSKFSNFQEFSISHEKKSYKKSTFFSGVVKLLRYPRSSFSPILGSIGPIQMLSRVYNQKTQYVSHLLQLRRNILENSILSNAATKWKERLPLTQTVYSFFSEVLKFHRKETFRRGI